MYDYETEKAELFTADGQVLFLKIRDNVKLLLKTSGAFRLQEAISGYSGTGWQMLACVDRLVELGEIIELPLAGVAGQHRVFIKAYK